MRTFADAIAAAAAAEDRRIRRENAERELARVAAEEARLAAEARRVAREAAVMEIRRCEAAQARPLRELAIDPTNEAARVRLAELDARIAAARRHL